MEFYLEFDGLDAGGGRWQVWSGGRECGTVVHAGPFWSVMMDAPGGGWESEVFKNRRDALRFVDRCLDYPGMYVCGVNGCGRPAFVTVLDGGGVFCRPHSGLASPLRPRPRRDWSPVGRSLAALALGDINNRKEW